MFSNDNFSITFFIQLLFPSNYIFHPITLSVKLHFPINYIFHQITFSIKLHFPSNYIFHQYIANKLHFHQITNFLNYVFLVGFAKNRLILLLCYFVENPRLRIYPQIIPKNLEESFEGEVVIHVQQITLFKKTFAKKKCSFLQVLENP